MPRKLSFESGRLQISSLGRIRFTDSAGNPCYCCEEEAEPECGCSQAWLQSLAEDENRWHFDNHEGWPEYYTEEAACAAANDPDGPFFEWYCWRVRCWTATTTFFDAWILENTGYSLSDFGWGLVLRFSPWCIYGLSPDSVLRHEWWAMAPLGTYDGITDTVDAQYIGDGDCPTYVDVIPMAVNYEGTFVPC
jgi:hypothetical protein